MKTTMILAFGAALLCGCTEVADRAADAADSSCVSFPVAEARGLFEEAFASRSNTRAESGPDDARFFAPGEVEPVWGEAREVPAGDFARVDVPVDATSGFYRFVPREGTDLLDEAAIPRTLAVMKDPAGERRPLRLRPFGGERLLRRFRFEPRRSPEPFLRPARNHVRCPGACRADDPGCER